MVSAAPSRQLTVLLIEDSDADAEWVHDQIGPYVDIIRARGVADAHRSGEADLVLLDLNLERSVGVDTLQIIRRGLPHLPIVVLSSVDDPHVEAMCLDAGAHSYYRKGTFDVRALVRSMEAAIIAWNKRRGDLAEVTTHENTVVKLLEMVDRIKVRLEELRGP